MGVKGIRTAMKVDFDKHASQQAGLHVCFIIFLRYYMLHADQIHRLEPVAPRWYV